MTSQGMIQVDGRTYRIVEIARATYRAVRIADETELGVFQCGSPLQLWSRAATAAELGGVARSAMRAGKTRWQAGPSPRSTLRAHAMVAVGMMLGLASCSGSPQPAVAPQNAPAAKQAPREAAPEPAHANAGSDLAAEERRMPDMPPRAASLDRVMHAHFHDAMLIRQAVIAGRPEQAIGPARVLSIIESDETLPASWREFVVRMQIAAQRVSRATSMEQAAAATADLAVTCGQCHQKLGGPNVPNEIPPPTGTTIEAWMKHHQWASERLWEGLVVPSAEAWSAGAHAMATSPVPEQLLAEEGSQGRRAADDLTRLVMRAPQLDDSERRAALYAELLVTCATCHRAVKHHRTE